MAPALGVEVRHGAKTGRPGSVWRTCGLKAWLLDVEPLELVGLEKRPVED